MGSGVACLDGPASCALLGVAYGSNSEMSGFNGDAGVGGKSWVTCLGWGASGGRDRAERDRTGVSSTVASLVVILARWEMWIIYSIPKGAVDANQSQPRKQFMRSNSKAKRSRWLPLASWPSSTFL